MPKKALFILFSLITLSVLSQETVNQHIVRELDKLYKEDYNRKKEIKIDGKKYRIYNNYLTLGAGKAYNSAYNDVMFTPAVDLNCHLQKTRFQIGALTQGRTWGDNKLVQFHLGLGYRKESYRYLWAVYGGLAYTDGYTPFQLKATDGSDSVKVLGHITSNGIYAAAQLFYKIKFDYGLGLTAFASYNKYQSIAGLRLELFFSGAYRGKLHNTDEE
ncbi:MAG: hypothetical protein ACXVPN_03185 [Bacteroidia bacterium]